VKDYGFGYRFARQIPRLNAKKRDKMRWFANSPEAGKMLQTMGFQAFRRGRNLAC